MHVYIYWGIHKFCEIRKTSIYFDKAVKSVIKSIILDDY
jgi:hypothetical protein